MCVGGLPNIVGYSITLFVCILHAWTAMRVFTAPVQRVVHGAYHRETPRLRDQEHSGQIVSHEKWKLGRGLFYWNSGVVPQSIRTQRPRSWLKCIHTVHITTTVATCVEPFHA